MMRQAVQTGCQQDVNRRDVKALRTIPRRAVVQLVPARLARHLHNLPWI